jgi:hypothetical protein
MPGKETAVESNYTSTITVSNGVSHQLRSDLTAVFIRHRKPGREPGIGIDLPPGWHRPVEGLFDAIMLRSLGYLAQMLILSPQLLERGRECVKSGTAGHVNQLVTLIVDVLGCDGHLDYPRLEGSAPPPRPVGDWISAGTMDRATQRTHMIAWKWETCHG